MEVLGVHFGDRDVEAGSGFIDQAPADMAFVFEGGGVGEVEGEAGGVGVHGGVPQ